MSSFNKVFLMGNLTRDVELRYTQSGTALATTAIAMNRKFKGAGGDLQEETTFVDLKLWGRQAEVWNQHVRRGQLIFVEGRLDQNAWEDQDGRKRSKHEVVVMDFQFLGQRAEQAAERPPAKREERELDFGDVPF